MTSAWARSRGGRQCDEETRAMFGGCAFTTDNANYFKYVV